ncbi:hypothetical protein H2202_006737 [Exophiala xenobiotica]|nr:hypothetical protein H2202_006737 [Exophiala xenobiotica]
MYFMVIISLTIVAALQPLDQLNARSPPRRTTASSLSSDITAAPKELQRRQDVAHAYSVYQGPMTFINTLGSVFTVLLDDHAGPLYIHRIIHHNGDREEHINDNVRIDLIGL